jgi:hypothetical protein
MAFYTFGCLHITQEVRGWQPTLGTLDHLVFLFSLPIFPRILIGLDWEIHGEILWEGRMIGRQPRPCMNLFVMYRWFGVVPQCLDVLFPFVLFGDFRSPFLSLFLERFRDLSLGDLAGDVCMNPLWFFSLWFPSQIREQRGLDFGVFGVLGLEEFLVAFLRFLLIWKVLVDKI